MRLSNLTDRHRTGAVTRTLSFVFTLVLLAPTAWAQSGTVTGAITDTDGLALPGASVRIDGTTLGAAADLDGAFTIAAVPAGERTVVVTLVGYRRATQSVTVAADREAEVSITLAEDVLNLSGVAVTASRFETDLLETPRAVEVVQQEVIDVYTQQSSDLSATLGKFIPNFSPPSIGNNIFTATLRGRTPLFLLDGVPLQSNEGLRGAVLGNIDPSVLDRIEVLYGASAIYGGGAPGGVIQFFTKEASENTIDADVTFFTRNYLVEGAAFDGEAIDFRTSATISGTLDKFTYLVNGAFETTNGEFRPDGERIAPTNTSQYDDVALFAKLGYELSAAQSVQVSFNRSYREPNDLFFGVQVRDVDVLADPEGSAAVAERVETAFSYDQPISQEYISVYGNYENRALGGGSLRLMGYYFDLNFQQGGSDIRSFIESGRFPSSWPGLWQTSTAATQAGARLEYVRPFSDQLLLSVGGDILQADDSTPVTISTDGPFDAENRFDAAGGVQDQGAPSELLSGGVFLQADYDALENLHLSAGLRYDYISFDILPFTPTFTRVEPGQQRLGGSGANSGLSVNLGAAYEFTPQTALFANFSQGFSLPSLGFLVVNVAPGIEVEGDEIVSPQVVNSVDLGVRGQIGDNFAYGLSTFFAFSEDASQIQFDTQTGQGRRVQAPQRNFGFEANLEAAPAPGFRVGADVSVTETEVDPQDDGTFQPGSSIDTVPLTTTFRVSYEIPSVEGLLVSTEVYTLNNRERAFTHLVDSNEDGIADV
ncbi:MAG: TonB-dependent receptor, partial [Bacteroidota bacterium]